jgi:outer membrane protein
MRLVNKKGLLVGLLVVSLAGNAREPLVLSLDDCIRIALDENPTIKIADQELERVDYANKEKLSALFPAINASASYGRTLKKQKLFFTFPGMPANPDGIEVGQDNSFAGVLQASMPIVSPTLWASLKMNETETLMALESARSSKLNLVNSITKAYYAVLMAQDSYDVFDRTYKSAADNASVIESKFKQGATSEFEWIRADVQVRNALTNLVSAESAVSISKHQLKMLMGMDFTAAIALKGKLSEFESIVFSEALQTAALSLNKNVDLNQFDIRAQQLKQSLEVQKTTWLPTLAASFNYQYMAQPNDDVKWKDYYWFPTSNVGLSLSIPLFQGGAKHYKKKQLEVQLKSMEHQRENLKRSLELQAVSLTDNMIKAIERMESGKKALIQADKALSIAQKMYEVGMSTFLDVNNAELGYVQAGLSYNQSIYDFMSAKADLEKLLGREVND